MGPRSQSQSSRSSSSHSSSRKPEPLLPYAEITDQPKPRSRRLGPNLQRKLLLWVLGSFVLVAILLFHAKEGPYYVPSSFQTSSDVVKNPETSTDAGHPVETSVVNTEKPSEHEVVPSTDQKEEGPDETKVELPTQEQQDKEEQGQELPHDDKEHHQQGDEQGPKVDQGSATDPGSEQQQVEHAQEEATGSVVDNGVKPVGDSDPDPEPAQEQDHTPGAHPLMSNKDEPEELDVKTQKQLEADLLKMPWLKFPHLDGYFHGLKALVSKADHRPEYPNATDPAPLPQPPLSDKIPKPKPYDPYGPASGRKTCYLDVDKRIPVPDMLAYDGLPQHMPDPAFGSYEVLGMRNDVCFDRFGRFGPYGLGYSTKIGGVGVGRATENSGSDATWEETGQISYKGIDWANVQATCLDDNKDRFVVPDPKTDQLPRVEGKMSRTAIVIRTYTDFRWTEHAVVNFRALISELSLKSGGEYTVHFLLHVRKEDAPIWSDELTVERLLKAQIPAEFQGLVTLWSEPQMKLYYPGAFRTPLSNPSRGDVHGVYRSAHFPLQVFALQHPEYEHFWNWEMDMRFTGNYYELLDRIGKWADKQPRNLLWERNARYYIPSSHGSWDNFTTLVEEQTAASEATPIFGPLQFAGRRPLRHEQHGGSNMPEEGCSKDGDTSQCGIGEPADLITLNPIFDTHLSSWVFGLDVTGYRTAPPRRCAIITASRLSRRLLMSMHEEVWRYHHTMFSEMFPASVALHHGFKATFAPHPVYIDRAWTPLGEAIDSAFNSGADHSTSGQGSPFDIRREHNHKGTSWYYNSEFAGLIWRRWLGYAQNDGRDRYGGALGRGTMRGGKEEEESEQGSGRMCLRGMLVHPIKHEAPTD